MDCAVPSGIWAYISPAEESIALLPTFKVPVELGNWEPPDALLWSTATIRP